MSEWADKYFYLSSESSYQPGPWTTIPFQRAILNSMGNDDIREVNWKKSARVGYTKCITVALAYFTAHRQRNQMMFQPAEASATDFMKQHAEPTIRDVPPLRALAPWYGKKHRDNTLDYKRFSNSRQWFIRGGNAAKNYREKSVDVVYFDELSSFDSDIEGEGSPVDLGDKRTSGSSFPKSIRGSTPKIKGSCQLSLVAEEADEHFYRHLPCPHCNHYQPLKFGGRDAPYGIKWDSEETIREAYYVCEKNGCVIERRHLDWMDENGVYVSATGITTDDGLIFEKDGERVPAPRSVCWYTWAAYSPMTTWGEIAHEFIRARKKPDRLKTFVNTTLGEEWEGEGETIDEGELYARREYYKAEVPQDAVVLTAAVDVQDDRLEIGVEGWGVGEENWKIAYTILRGDPGRKELWDRLDEVLSERFQHESGARLQIACTAIDSGGHYAEQVYRFCKPREVRRVYAIKGASSGAGTPLVGRPSKSNKGGVNLFPIGTYAAKEIIYARLRHKVPGTGYVHFPVKEDFDAEYFAQLTAEKLVKVKLKHVWKAIRKRNEALDISVYNLAALQILNPKLKLLAAKLAPVEQVEETVNLLEPEQPTPTKPKKRRRKGVRKIGSIR